MVGKPIKEGKISQKDLVRGRLVGGIREGKMPIKGEDMAIKEGSKKNIKGESREEREKVRNEIFLFLYKS